MVNHISRRGWSSVMAIVASLAAPWWLALILAAVVLAPTVAEFALRWRFGANIIARARENELVKVVEVILKLGESRKP